MKFISQIFFFSTRRYWNIFLKLTLFGNLQFNIKIMLWFKFPSRKGMLHICQRIWLSTITWCENLTKPAGTRYICSIPFCVSRTGWKEISDGKVRFLILCITRWKCNLFSLSSCREFCRRFTTIPPLPPPVHVRSRIFTRARMCAGHDETHAFPIYMRILVHEFAHVYTMYFSQPLARSYSKALFEETRF